MKFYRYGYWFIILKTVLRGGLVLLRFVDLWKGVFFFGTGKPQKQLGLRRTGLCRGAERGLSGACKLVLAAHLAAVHSTAIQGSGLIMMPPVHIPPPVHAVFTTDFLGS